MIPISHMVVSGQPPAVGAEAEVVGLGLELRLLGIGLGLKLHPSKINMKYSSAYKICVKSIFHSSICTIELFPIFEQIQLFLE